MNDIAEPDRNPPQKTAEVLAYRIADAVAVSGLSRTTIYALMAAGKLRTVKIGGRRLVPRAALAELLQPTDR